MLPPQQQSQSPLSEPSSPSGLPPHSSFKHTDDDRLIRRALHQSPFFTCLDDEQVERLVAAAQLKEYAPNEIVILEGCVDDDDTEVSETEEEPAHQQGPLQRQHSASHGPADVEEAMEVGDEGESPLLHEQDEGRDGSGSSTGDKPAEAAGSTDTNGSNETDGTGVDERTESVTLAHPDTSEDAKDQETLDAGLSEQSSTDPLHSEPQHEAFLNDESRQSEADESLVSNPPPPRSGIPRSLYIVRKGRADVWYQKARFNPFSLGPGSCFGEGGFLFGRAHSASVVANRMEPLQCWVIDVDTFRKHVLPSESMTRLFRKYATKQDRHGKYYLTMDEFVKACHEEDQHRNNPMLQTATDPLVNFRIVNMYNILNQRGGSRGGRSSSNNIYLTDFCLFHLLIARPDPEVDIAFLLMDQRQTGQIYLDDLVRFLKPIFPNLDFDSQFFHRYFGHDKNYAIRQAHFSQFLVDLQREMGKQTFLQAVRDHGREGCLGPKEFVRVIKASCGWRLPQGVVDRLESIYCHGPVQAGEAAVKLSVKAGTYKGSSAKEVARATEEAVLGDMEHREKQLGIRYFNYADFLAFQEVLAFLPGICNLIDRAQEIKKGPISPDDFKVANKVIGLGSRLSRRQVEIIFSLFDLDRDGFVAHEDTVSVCGVDFAQRLAPEVGRGGALTFAPPPKFRHEASETSEDSSVASAIVGESLGHFSLSAFAGALGVIALYPLDLIKTRLMHQRLVTGESRLYAGSWDCFRQVLRSHGFTGLYRGLLPQLLGSAPEKAIKLHVNDLMMNSFKSFNDESDAYQNGNVLVEALAGACAGACQLLVSNPMELSKTRLILQDEMSQMLKMKSIETPRAMTFTEVVRDLGFPQIQVHGATACLLRDIPFSAIYFPSYAACKRYLAEQRPSGQVTLSDLLAAGTLAAVPSALITTPCDVIRVRLQSIPRPGEIAYSGIRDCATRVFEQEGIRAFFQGAWPRVFRIAPQFGISLLAYEQLTSGLGFPSANRPPTNAPVDPRDYRTAFPTSSSIYPKATDIDGWMRSFGMKPPGDPTGK